MIRTASNGFTGAERFTGRFRSVQVFHWAGERGERGGEGRGRRVWPTYPEEVEEEKGKLTTSMSWESLSLMHTRSTSDVLTTGLTSLL